MKIAIIASGIVLALAAIVGGSYAISHRAHSPQAIATASATPAARPSIAPPAPTPVAESTPVDKSIGIIHAGEGIEHALTRQLMADPSIAGFQGDESEQKQWAGHEAHILALKAGYIGTKFGEEIRVALPDTMAYIIEKDPDGKLKIVEYSAVQIATPSAEAGTPGETTFAQVSSHGVATTIATAHFIGPQDGTTVLPAPYRSFEYMYVG